MKQIIFGGGCFWCIEAVFSRVIGVKQAVSGYTDGNTENPTYQSVCTGQTGHVEAVKISYDEAVIGLNDLLNIFFHVHDPTTINRQGNDTGTQYRSAIYFDEPADEAVILKKIEELEKNNVFPHKIVTQVLPKQYFYEAEVYHKDYFGNNPYQPYCMAVINPKLKKFMTRFSQFTDTTA